MTEANKKTKSIIEIDKTTVWITKKHKQRLKNRANDNYTTIETEIDKILNKEFPHSGD